MARKHGILDANYNVERRGKDGILLWRCPYYSIWSGMIHRATNEKYKQSSPSYIGASVCEEWIYFSNFKAWMEKQNWQGKELDKDIILRGNRHYSPETCVFVDGFVNKLFRDSFKKDRTEPFGVYWATRDKTYVAQISENGKTRRLGCSSNKLAAHKLWQKAKLEHIEDYLSTFDANLSQNNMVVALTIGSKAAKLRKEIESNQETRYL